MFHPFRSPPSFREEIRTVVAEPSLVVLADALFCVRVIVEAFVPTGAVAVLEQPVAVWHPAEVVLVQELALVSLFSVQYVNRMVSVGRRS